jgi:hypothetical protein
MQGIYTYIPETNHVPKEHNVAAILLLLFLVPISLAPALALMYFYISTFRSVCVVPSVAVFWSCWTPWFPGMVLTYFLNDFEMVPVTPIITGYIVIIIIIIIIIIINGFVIGTLLWSLHINQLNCIETLSPPPLSSYQYTNKACNFML